MAIIIKEIHVRSTVYNDSQKRPLSDEMLQQLKKSIAEEIDKRSKNQVKWAKER